MDTATSQSLQAKPTSVAETLRAARAKIEDPNHWTKGAFARPSKRSAEEVSLENPAAQAWCALGSIRAIDGRYEDQALNMLIKAIESPYQDTEKIWRFNDRPATRHRDILRVFDKAIALAEAQS